MIVADLMLDLDVFQGPFDLLLALVMREEIELAELPIAEVVVAYIEHAYDDGVLDLESASEFLVLIAALLEIKVRLLFPGEEDDEEPFTAEQAEAELLARLIAVPPLRRRRALADGRGRRRAARLPGRAGAARAAAGARGGAVLGGPVGAARRHRPAARRRRPRSTSPPSAAGSSR